MKIIAGLGNPGARYEGTPHNIGFEAVDAIASGAGAVWENKKAFKCLMARCGFGGCQVLLVKPQTFMNLSGDSIAPVVRYHNAALSDLIVIHDDIDLPVGRMRIRKGGSSGGHNGIRSIAERLGSCDFLRIKLGVGKDKSNVVAHVLGRFAPEVRGTMDRVVAASVDAAAKLLADGAGSAMNEFNGWSADGGA